MKTFYSATDTREYSTENPNEIIESKFLYENGNIYEHCFFLNGKLHGEYKWLYINGTIAENCFYKDGKEQGEYKSFNKDGTLTEHCFYVDGVEQPQLQYLTTDRDETTLTLLFGDCYI